MTRDLAEASSEDGRETYVRVPDIGDHDEARMAAPRDDGQDGGRPRA
jgi:hypothetical protein